MLNFPALTRRYTPPTCTLQIKARRSPLSRWQSQPVVKNLRFELRFDDPRQLRDRHEQVTLSGDREQLDTLCDLVATYIQDVVLQATATMPLRSQAIAAEPSPRRASEPPPAPDTAPVIPGLANRARGLALEPQGLLQHQLHFGSLAQNPNQASVQLSATQLFDLASALDDYSAEVTALPKLSSSTSAPSRQVPAWAGTAATVVVAIGLTTALMRLSQTWQNQPVAESDTSIAQGDEPILDRAPLGLEAVPPLPSPPPVPTTTLPPELEGLETLPPPVGVGRLDPPIPQTADPRYRGGGARASGDSGTAESSDAEAAPGASSSPANPPSASTRNSQRQLVLPSPDGPPQIPRNLPPVASAQRRAASAETESALEPRSPAPAPPAPAPEAASRPQVNLPQVSEVRQYFQGRWQPPENLSSPVEYRLWLNRDGSLQRIAPVGNAAATYLDRTRMPLLGEPFVSPLSGSGTPQVRLVLEADGSVEAYLEALN